MSLWDQVKANMSEWYGIAADKTEEMARIGVRKYDRFSLSREIERAFMELGGHVYGEVRAGRTDLAGDGDVQRLVERIRGLEQQLEQKEREIQAIRDAARVRTPGRFGGGAGDDGSQVAETASEGSARPGEAVADDDAEIEASLDPGNPPATVRPEDAWDDEMALWSEPLEMEDDTEGEPGGEEGDGSGRRGD